MDIQKAQRLSQYLGVIIDMVQYVEIGQLLIEAGVLSNDEHKTLLQKLEIEGNALIMHELLTIINLRRGGFDVLLSVLRRADYSWVADQLEPDKCITESNEKKSVLVRGQSLMGNVKQRISRKSDPCIIDIKADESEITYGLSYRDSCPINIPINPSFYTNTEHQVASSSKCLSLDNSTTITNTETDNESLLTNLHIDVETGKQAIVYNVAPEQMTNVPEYFSELAKRANVPSPMVQDLKVIQSGRIHKSKSKRQGVKLKFNSENARNKFVENLTDFITHIEPTDALYSSISRLEVTVPETKPKRWGSKVGRLSVLSRSRHSTKDKEQRSTHKHWYQKPFKLWK